MWDLVRTEIVGFLMHRLIIYLFYRVDSAFQNYQGMVELIVYQYFLWWVSLIEALTSQNFRLILVERKTHCLIVVHLINFFAKMEIKFLVINIHGEC